MKKCEQDHKFLRVAARGPLCVEFPLTSRGAGVELSIVRLIEL
jgi:hypothetical protein